jgi:hypothetical protein
MNVLFLRKSFLGEERGVRELHFFFSCFFLKNKKKKQTRTVRRQGKIGNPLVESRPGLVLYVHRVVLHELVVRGSSRRSGCGVQEGAEAGWVMGGEKNEEVGSREGTRRDKR